MLQNVAVVIPVYKQYVELSAMEKKSLHNTCNVLNNYDIIFVTHSSISIDGYCSNYVNEINFKTFFFSKEYFLNIAGYNKLMLNLEFYEKFSAYQYILICQLDVFVFSDNLTFFIKKKYDYIGAPWFEGFDKAHTQSNIIGVGNGGFSLRKVKSFLSILYTLEAISKQKFEIKNILIFCSQFIPIIKLFKHEYYRKKYNYETPFPWETLRYEDDYWARLIKIFFPWFRVGSVEDAISFAFEVNPEVLFSMNQNKLPMATHAWEKYSPGFWKKFIN